MTRLQQKKHFNGCGVSIRPQPVFSYPKGHPCHGCPYTFRTDKPSCTMGGRPGDCAWYFYRRLMEKPKPPPPTAPDNPTPPVRSAEYEVIENCIEKLCRVAERKFGREYAEQLRQRRFSTP